MLKMKVLFSGSFRGRLLKPTLAAAEAQSSSLIFQCAGSDCNTPCRYHSLLWRCCVRDVSGPGCRNRSLRLRKKQTFQAPSIAPICCHTAAIVDQLPCCVIVPHAYLRDCCLPGVNFRNLLVDASPAFGTLPVGMSIEVIFLVATIDARRQTLSALAFAVVGLGFGDGLIRVIVDVLLLDLGALLALP